MTRPVLLAASYILVHAPQTLLQVGSTPVLARRKGGKDEYLKQLPGALRPFQEAMAYPPNQAFIGNLDLAELQKWPRPWYANPVPDPKREGQLGAIFPEEEFYGILKAADSFDLVELESDFVAGLCDRPFLKNLNLGTGATAERLQAEIETDQAVPLLFSGQTVGCVKRAHDLDENLAAPVMLENLACKGTAFLAVRQLLQEKGLAADEIDYLIETSEEACGDINQRGGGNFAKAVAEMAGLKKATGADIRSFCSAPIHGLVAAAALVQAGVFRQVMVCAGGAAAKLGLNSRDHVKQGLPVLEDVLAAFAFLVGPDDGRSPVIRTDVVGRNMIGTGSSPQAVITALVQNPLQKAGLKITAVDRYAAELHNPEVTEPAGAGDVPRSNYRLIGALAVKNGELERQELDKFVAEHGMVGFAPTQGHVPSGVPYLGRAVIELQAGDLQRAMVIGKGSLFLARMTGQFDGISVLLERNGLSARPQVKKPTSASPPQKGPVVAMTVFGEDTETIETGLDLAKRAGIQVLGIGPAGRRDDWITTAACWSEVHQALDQALQTGQAQAAVAMHYNFPLGVATVARLVAPGNGREFFLATTTGTTASSRVLALVRNTVLGRAVARAWGIADPVVGLLNLDGAQSALRLLQQLRENGYRMRLAASRREESAALLRGNDLLAGSADVVVCDTLTGNLLVKMLGAYGAGGLTETQGSGYGPGVGADYQRLICIVSRASAAPVIAGAISMAAHLAGLDLPARVQAELAEARQAGLEQLEPQSQESEEVNPPPAEPVTVEVGGLDVLEIENGLRVLWRAGIYAESGMGCTGPVLLVPEGSEESARQALRGANFLP
ncbi:MAG TPA: glycine reductase [Firmicutes bacterium]|jgi:hypothetical protein|nr:glycine reductase [Bacillota bacterium]